MEYITMKVAHYPGAFTDTEAAMLRTVSRMGLWLVAPADLNMEQIRALLTLRSMGYVELAAYGGYRIKTNQYAVGEGLKPSQDANMSVMIRRVA